MDTTDKKLVFFDVDYTLIDGNSGFFASLRFVKHGILKKRRILQALYYTLCSFYKDQDVKKIYQIAIADMIGKSIDEILKIGLECLEKDLIPRFFDESVKMLKSHQEKGDIVILLSSGSSIIMSHVARYLGVNDFYAIGPRIENNLLTNNLPNPLCYAEGKIYYAQLAEKKYGLPLKQAFFYTDHHTDIPLLERVGFPHCVNPDRKLKRHALQKNWPIHRVTRASPPPSI
ncbi:MAG: HAD-superfamily subfamily IB hydrolase, TIGR01490 [uncultured bacterium]|nr:MAG: HAD-superfamily subfamily IB hydrolase, TIGR01490 [uncultured bacterium]